MVCLATLPLLVALLGASQLIRDFSNIDFGESSRQELYALTLDAIATAPWHGIGLGGYQEAFRLFASPELSREEFDFAHNSYLENAFELGVPATVALYLALFWIGGQIWLGVSRRERMRAIPALGIAAIVAGGSHALVDFSLQMPAAAAFFAMILGLAWARSFHEGRRRRSDRQSV